MKCGLHEHYFSKCCCRTVWLSVQSEEHTHKHVCIQHLGQLDTATPSGQTACRCLALIMTPWNSLMVISDSCSWLHCCLKLKHCCSIRVRPLPLCTIHILVMSLKQKSLCFTQTRIAAQHNPSQINATIFLCVWRCLSYSNTKRAKLKQLRGIQTRLRSLFTPVINQPTWMIIRETEEGLPVCTRPHCLESN